MLQIPWGKATALLGEGRRLRWIDLLLIVGVVGVILGVIDLGREWSGELRPIDIDLDNPWILPQFTFFSLTRGLIAYCLSLAFTLVYGYWTAKDARAERVLVPLLDILQSIPVLSFLPGLVLVFVALFPTTNTGLELAAILMIFTGQAWNMTFSFYHSLRSVPQDLREVGQIYRLNVWQRLRWLELPFATMGLVWNSMMSMAGGWFFLMINEAFRLGERDFRLPGVGSYMSVAVERGRVDAMLWAIFAMVLMIVGLDQLLWRPVVVWAQIFRVEEGGLQTAASSWFLDWLRGSRLLRLAKRWLRRLRGLKKLRVGILHPVSAKPVERHRFQWGQSVSLAAFILLLAALVFGAWQLFHLLEHVTLAEWLDTAGAASITLSRVLLSTALGTLWALPTGLAIGLSPRLSNLLQPVVQVLASFPAPMLFPLIITFMNFSGIPLGWGSILLMLLGTQWYILFNVVAGAMAVPADLKEAANSYRLSRWQRFRKLYVPAVFPFLVTGWVTAAGGAWNASIVSEFVTFHGEVQTAWGLGSQISLALTEAPPNFPLLAASTLVMCVVVVVFNRTVWRYCYHLAEKRFSLNK
ncbi:MAG: ABC transporter permease subunit [Planctomycetes bacterium]|nr:ABC transporter permease subunit [Planctomycetota bacterium]